MELDKLPNILQQCNKHQIVFLAKQLYHQKTPPRLLLELTFHQNPRTAFRVAWLLDHLCEQFPEYLKNTQSLFLENFHTIENESCKRHYARILSNVLQANVFNTISNDELDSITNTCFDWLHNSQIKAAVKAHCIDILVYLSKKNPSIGDILVQELNILQETTDSKGLKHKIEILICK